MCETVDRYRELFLYDAKTGLLTRRINSGKGRAGAVVGTLHSAGYLQVRVNAVWHYVHRTVWAMRTGSLPTQFIDHRNGVRTDNRWRNLREATHAQNMQNSCQRSHSKNPFKGVRPTGASGKWMARITVRGKEKHLGSFETVQEARRAYLTAAKEHFTHYTTR